MVSGFEFLERRLLAHIRDLENSRIGLAVWSTPLRGFIASLFAQLRPSRLSAFPCGARWELLQFVSLASSHSLTGYYNYCSLATIYFLRYFYLSFLRAFFPFSSFRPTKRMYMDQEAWLAGRDIGAFPIYKSLLDSSTNFLAFYFNNWLAES